MTYLSDADDHGEGGSRAPEPLRELILAQGRQETGIFVLLFTSSSASGDAAVGDAAAAQLVERLAIELGVDLQSTHLFSPDAYALQAALGEASLPLMT